MHWVGGLTVHMLYGISSGQYRGEEIIVPPSTAAVVLVRTNCLTLFVQVYLRIILWLGSKHVRPTNATTQGQLNPRRTTAVGETCHFGAFNPQACPFLLRLG